MQTDLVGKDEVLSTTLRKMSIFEVESMDRSKLLGLNVRIGTGELTIDPNIELIDLMDSTIRRLFNACRLYDSILNNCMYRDLFLENFGRTSIGVKNPVLSTYILVLGKDVNYSDPSLVHYLNGLDADQTLKLFYVFDINIVKYRLFACKEPIESLVYSMIEYKLPIERIKNFMMEYGEMCMMHGMTKEYIECSKLYLKDDPEVHQYFSLSVANRDSQAFLYYLNTRKDEALVSVFNVQKQYSRSDLFFITETLKKSRVHLWADIIENIDRQKQANDKRYYSPFLDGRQMFHLV